ncbi:xanthine dehydrogenase family protein subunit M [Paraburkholderia sp. 22B1P]|uniref:FAD binding domain-containing protein n=1 Tax=Paraburkholderia sp. 22B1P TaxID=3080498 RepID=UPI0030898FF5|nr:xanthine dehydrogenase family protein subunit M [Paraburkholderia sp. 22B1P]
MRNFAYVRGTSIESAAAAHSQTDGSAYLAGGTTLLDLMKLDVMRPKAVVDIHKLPLARIEVLDDGRVSVGAMVTNTELARHEVIRTNYPVLSEALLSGATTQLRNKATTGGNVMQRVRCGYFRDGISPCNKREPGSGCAAIDGHNRNVHAVLGTSTQCIAAHPSDMCVAMTAIGATARVTGPRGSREIAFSDFHLLPGDTPWKEHALEKDEIVTHIVLDRPMQASRSSYLKLRDRASYQFALASSAVILSVNGGRINDVRIALGGVATKPWRATEAEAVLRGQPPSAALFAAAAQRAFQAARPYSQNGFKVPLGQQAIVRNLSNLTA